MTFCRYIVATVATGEIVRTVMCMEEQAGVQAQDGEVLIESADAGPSTHYVSNGEAVAYTEAQRSAKAVRPEWATGWDNEAMAWIDPRTLADHKRAARQRMATAWNEARAAGVTLGTKTAPTDADSWTRYLAIKEMAGEAGWLDVPVTLADGTFELLTQAKAATLWGALKDMERTLLTRLRDRVQTINSAATQAAVEAVVW